MELDGGVTLLFSDTSPAPTGLAYQHILDSDWIHIQFRIDGEGHEVLGNGKIVSTTSQSCIVARYEKNKIITRETLPSDHWRTACLFLKPEKLKQFFDIPSSSLDKTLQWLGDPGKQESQSIDFSLHPMALMAINDLFNCPLRHDARRAYMKAKSIELLSIVVHFLQVKVQLTGPAIKMSANDISSIEQAHHIISDELETLLTLAELAKRVGVNRSKLAYGFKSVYGFSVQAYWRDIRLSHARQLLMKEGFPVTQVAGMIGYTDPLEHAVLSVTSMQAGDTYSVMPDTASIKGGERCFFDEIGDHIRARFYQLTNTICEGFGVEVSIDYKRITPAVVNAAECTERVYKAARNFLPPESVSKDTFPVMASEDFSYMLKVIPGAYIWLGNGSHTGSGSPCLLLDTHYEFNDELLTVGATFWSKLVESILA